VVQHFMSQSDSPDFDLPNPATQPDVLSAFDEAPVSSASGALTDAEGSGSISADLLNDVVERARFMTNASDAAIALKQDAEIVCLATTGSNAPDIGVRLDLNAGLSGACAQSKTFQRCDDAETDSRLDPIVCRRLGFRSVLVSPILRGDELLGIVEVFSPNSHAFGDRDVQALAALSRTVSYILDRPAGAAAQPVPADVPASLAPEGSPTNAPKIDRQLDRPLEDQPEMAARAIASPTAIRQDYGTSILMGAIIILAITLGWLLGHDGPLRNNTAVQNPNAGKMSSPTPVSPAVSGSAVADSPSATAQSVPPSAPKQIAAALQAPNTNELTIVQNGKVIYREPEPHSKVTNSSSSNPRQSGISKAVLVSPETANQYLVQRVEPEYPEPAREQHLQGPVTMLAIIGKDGSVKTLETISGDPQLAAAARSAVLQWRFQPYIQDGKSAEFQTQVTVNFRLP